jgi:hypothetical protein
MAEERVVCLEEADLVQTTSPFVMQAPSKYSHPGPARVTSVAYPTLVGWLCRFSVDTSPIPLRDWIWT